jgi:hypothetical protein
MCEISIKAGAWSASYPADLRSPDFPFFREQLEHLQHDPAGVAVFDTLEGQLKLHLNGDHRGHIAIRGTARDKVGTGNELGFQFEIDQSFLPELIAELKLVEQQFPSHGLR